jgi:hypothetical protein
MRSALFLCLSLFFLSPMSLAKTEVAQLSPMQHCLWKCASRGMEAHTCARRCGYPMEKHYGELFNSCIKAGRESAACVKSAYTEASASMEKSADAGSAQRKVKPLSSGGAQ